MLPVPYIVRYHKIPVCNPRNPITSAKIEKHFACLKINISCFEIFCRIIPYKSKRCREMQLHVSCSDFLANAYTINIHFIEI